MQEDAEGTEIDVGKSEQWRGEGRGDEFVRIKVLTPKNLSARQKKLLREFEDGGSDLTNNPEKKSFIDKLKDLFE